MFLVKSESHVRRLPKSFYTRKTEIVARALLGKILFHKIDKKITSGTIVEIEAYLGSEDPASRASNGKTKISKPMWAKPGRILLYVVHGNLLFNIIAHEVDKVGAVLIRALEPLEGIELMKRRREIENIENLTSGPGKLSEALGIDKKYNGKDITDPKLDLDIRRAEKEDFEIESSHRIGVSEDLEEELRFFIKGNRFVSQ